MTNNVIVETHYTQNMNRPVTGDSETYQQCNYQTFQMLVLSVVDQSHTDEVRLKHLQNISENIEILSTLPNYPGYIDLLIKNFLRSLIETDTIFIIPSNAQTIRKQMIEVFHRLPISDALRGYVKDILSPMFKLLTKENEENALLLLRIIVEYMKQFRPQMINEVREFLQFVHNVYRQKASALDQIFLTKTFSYPTMTINEIDISNIIEQICSSVQLTVKKTQNISITTDEPSNSSSSQVVLDTVTILSRASHSVKLLAEFPVAIVLLYQLCRQSLQGEFGELVPLFLRYLTLQPSKEQKSDSKFNMEIYIEFLTTQAKTLSFLAFVGKAYQEQLALHSELLVVALIQLLDGCPPENVQLRKDIIVAARHFLSSDFRTLFIPHVKRFFDENLLLSTGYTARETLKPLAYNTFGDFFNHIRASLSIEDLQSVLYMYSKMIHDSSLPPTIQVMSLKFLTNIAEAIRQKGSDKTRDLLIRVVEILVFKCKSLAKQCAHLTANSNEKSNIPTIAPINEVDITTCSLNELVQNMNDITNREREIQRQQFSLIRFQATSPLIFTLSSSDCRTLLKVLVSSLRHITWILADVKISSENLVTQPKQFPPSITILYVKFLKYILQCLTIFFDSTLSINSNGNSSTITNPTNVTRNKEEKEIMDMIASVFIVMHKQNYREIFENNLVFFYQCANKNPNITLIMNTLLQQSHSSTILVELLLEFLLPRINEIGENNNTNNACLKLFKLVINSVVTTTLASENEKILQPYLKQIILRSIECAQLTQDPYNYFILLRALFRSIGVGNHELLNQEFLTLLHFLLQRLNEYQSCQHRQHLRELFIELCLTVPVRLSVLLPYLPLLMEPLVNALNGSSTLILQGLRTLELCVDNLQPDFLYNHILPVRSSLMLSLYRLLNNSNNDIAQNTFRILGKLGGNNRRILNEPQQIKYDNEEEENEIYVQMFFENEFKSISIPLLKILRTCADQLKSSITDQNHIKRQAWLIVQSVFSVLISNDDDHDLVIHLLNHSSFLNGKISECPSIWNANIEIKTRHGHDLLLQCLHQAATCKTLADEVLPLLKSTIQHYTLVSLTQQTGPLSSETYNSTDSLDCSIILIDSIVSCYIDIDDELNSIGRLSFDTLFNTLLTMFNNDSKRLTQLPLINYLIDTLYNHCHDRMWYSKQGSCRFFSQLCLNYFPNENKWFLENLTKIFHGFFHVIISLTDEISSGTLDIISNMIKEFLEKYAQIKSNETIDENLIELFLNYIFSPITYVRNLIYDCFRQLSQLFQQSIARLIEPFKNDLIKTFSSLNILPFKNQSLIYQITYLDIYIYFRTLEPKLSYITLFDDDLFKELTTFITLDDNELIKFSSYRSLTQQQLTLNIVLLKKLSLRTIGEYYEQIEYRDRVLRLFYKILTTIQSNELQLIAYESIEKIFNGHQNDNLRLRFVDLYLQQISFHDNEKLNLTPQIAQTLFYLSKLSPNSFDERLSEQLVSLIRKLIQSIAQAFRSNFDIQNHFYKTCLILLDLLATLPTSSKRIIESLTTLILKFDKHLMIESSSSCRKHLIELLIRHPQISLDQFMNGENRLQDLQWSRLFLDLLKTSSSSSNIQTFVRTNWLDRFRQILSDHIVSIETTQNIPAIICITIRSLSILVRTDQIWWSRQHELVSLLLRLWRSNTFQQHSFISSEHFDCFCSKELNNVLNLCLIYYQYYPERIRLLLELTRIYSCTEKLFYPKRFFNFIQDTIIKTYSLKWKRDTLYTFISLRNDESYTLECKSLFFEYILLPSFTYEFENNPTQITNELFQINPTNEETIVDLFIRTMIDIKYLQQIHDKYRISLLRFLCLFLEYNPQIICDTITTTTNKRDNEKIRRLMECAYATLLMNNIDSTFKCQAHLLLCYIISKYSIVKKIIMHVFNSLLKSYMIDAKYLVRQATDLLIPAIPIRMDDGYDILAYCTKKILSDDAHGNLQLIHIMSIIVRHQVIYFHVRYILANLMIQSAQKIAGQQTNSTEQKKLAIDIVEVIIKWELRKHFEQINDQKTFNRSLIDTIFVFLIRHACQINIPAMIPLSQQCIRLFKISRKYAWPNVDVKLATFERLIHQIELPNVTTHNSIAIAIDLLAFLISTFTVIQIKYTMRTLKRSLIACVSITNNPRLVESMQNLFSKLIIQIPIEPPAAIIPTSSSTTNNTQPPLTQQLVQATLASLATTSTSSGVNSQQMLANNLPLSTSMINKSEDIEQFYTVITKTIIDNMNSTATSMVNTTDRIELDAPEISQNILFSARTTVGANTTNTSSTGFGSIHTLPVAFGYLKIIEKQQPKYVDKLTPHITKLLQKLIKDHTSAGVDYNAAFTEYIIECLTLLKYRIGQLTSDLRKQFMNNFLPCLIEKSHDITLVRAIIRLVYDWLKWRGDVQLVPSLKEKSQLLLKLLQCIDKSGRFHHPQSNNDNDLTNSFLELILHVYQESNYRELCIKLEAAFILGLKSTNQQLRKQFFLILDKNLRKTLHDRLLFIFLSQNWEYLGQHYWIKQCLELFYTCVSSTIPLSIVDNRSSVLPALTSVIKSSEFYDRYDFMIDYVKIKNPSAIENVAIKTEQNADAPIKMEVNEETSTQNPAYSIISNALGVTAMSTLVTKKQRSSSICMNESKSKHFKQSIAFENIRRLSTDKLPETIERESTNKTKLTELINDEITFLKNLSTIQLKANDLFDSIIQFLHTNNSIVIDKLTHELFIDILPKILRIIPEKYRVILFQQIIQPFFVSGTHLQQRDLYPYSSLNTLLEAFYFMFTNNNNLSEFVPIIRPIILKYIGKTHNTWHRSILLLEQYILDQQHQNHEFLTNDETYIESLNSLSELYEHLNEDDYNISLWLHRQLSPNIKLLVSNALQYEQLGSFQQALEYYTQSIKLLENDQTTTTTTSSSSSSNRFYQLDEFSFLEQHWIKCTKELNQWDTLMSFCKQQSNRDHLLYLDCSWKSGNWPLMKETLGQLDAMCNGTNMNLTNSSIQTFQFLNQNPTLTQSTIISNILTIKDFQWKFALYRCYLTLCSTITNTDDPTIYQTTMNITERLIDYCSLNALKEWKHLPTYITNSHLNLLQASQRIIELQESAQILLNIQTNTNNNNTSTSIISTTTNGNTSTTTTNIRQTTNIHELKTIVKTWKSRLPLINDSLSFWNDIFTWRELQYMTISSQFDKDLVGANLTTTNNSNNNTGQVLLGIHAIAQSITQLGKIARKHHMPNVCMEILSRIGTVIPSVPVVDSYQKIKQIIKCYLILLPTLTSNDVQEIFDLIEQANTKYFNKDMMSEFYSLKALAYSRLNLNDDAQKLFSCATQLSDTNLTRTWINWGDFLLKQSSITNDDESIIICYLNACKDLSEIKARSILSKIFYLLSRDSEENNSNKLSICIERYLSLIPVQHWLFWLPQIMNKLIRNESSQCMFAILNELIRSYPQAVYVQIKKSLVKLIENQNDEKQIPSTPVTPSIENSLNLPIISYRQQALNNLNRLEQILLEQHPTIVRTLDIIIEQLNTINETFFQYMIKRLYQCQRKIYQDLFENKKELPDDVKQIIQHLKELLNNDEKEFINIKQIKIQFSNDFNQSVLNNTHISRSFILLISKWISLIERRIEQTEPRIKYLNQTKYLHLLSFNSQITNDINMPGELWHAPEANFYFRINKFFPTIERIFKHERYFNRLTIRAHNGKIMYYLLSNNYQIISSDKTNYQWESEENTLQFLKMINNICIRKEKELLKRHMQLFLPHLCTYLPSLRLIEDNRLTINLIDIYNDRLMLPIRKYYELIDEDQSENLLNIYQLIQNEYFSNRQFLHQWTLNEYSNATGYFSFRKIFTISMSFYSTLNYVFGFYMYANNQLNIQRSIGNINPLYLKLRYDLNKQEEKISLTPNIDMFINRFGKMGPLTATILATLTSLAQPKYQIIEYLKIFYKEDIHMKHPELTQKECVELVEKIARQLETKLNQFTDFDRSKTIVSQLVQTSTDTNQLSRLNPLYYPWL